MSAWAHPLVRGGKGSGQNRKEDQSDESTLHAMSPRIGGISPERPGVQGVDLYLLASSWLSSLLSLSLTQPGRSWLRPRQSEDKVTVTWAVACSSAATWIRACSQQRGHNGEWGDSQTRHPTPAMEDRAARTL